MAPFYSCDHCGRTGVTFGVYYPGGDMSQPALHLCQSDNGTPIEPNCYHLVLERGEALGLRKQVQIRATDRHSLRAEAATLRFTQDVATGTILTETEPPKRPTQHPLTGQVIDTTPPPKDLDPGITEAEKNKGIINPDSANQRPLINPDSPEGKAYLDGLVEAEIARRNVLPPSAQRTWHGESPYVPGGQSPDDRITPPPADAPADPITTAQPHVPTDVITNAPFDPAATTKTPAQVAAEAQQKADADNAARRAKKAPAKKAPAKKAAKPPVSASAQESTDNPPVSSNDQQTTPAGESPGQEEGKP